MLVQVNISRVKKLGVPVLEKWAWFGHNSPKSLLSEISNSPLYNSPFSRSHIFRDITHNASNPSIELLHTIFAKVSFGQLTTD